MLVFSGKTLQNTPGFFKKSLQNFEGLEREEYTPRGYPEIRVSIYYTTKKGGLSRGEDKIFLFLTKRKKLVMTNKSDPVLKWNMLDWRRGVIGRQAGSFFSEGGIFFSFIGPFLSFRGRPFSFHKSHPLLKRSNLPV